MFWKFLSIKRQIVHLCYILTTSISFCDILHMCLCAEKKHWFDLIVWLLWYDIDYRYIWHSDIMSYVSCCLLAKYWYLSVFAGAMNAMVCWQEQNQIAMQKVAKDANINKDKDKVLCYIPVIVRLLFWRFNRNTFWWKYIKHVELIKTLT